MEHGPIYVKWLVLKLLDGSMNRLGLWLHWIWNRFLHSDRPPYCVIISYL